MQIKEIFNFLCNIFIIKIIKGKNNIQFNGTIHINKMPKISTCNNGSIVIGNNVTLNSNNTGYHVNMFSPVKIVADKPIGFRMTLYKAGLGILEDKFYPHFKTALAHSCNYGFIPGQWVQTEDK